MMGSADILPLGSADPFPRGEVLDLAVSVAIGRDLARSEDEMFALIRDWFLRPLSASELSASPARLLDRGSITRRSDEPIHFGLTYASIDATTTMSSGMMRMIDSGRGHIKIACLLQMLELEKGNCP